MGEKELRMTIQSFDELAPEYVKNRMDIGMVKHLADFFLEHVPGKKILDVGCGPGRDAKYFAMQGCSVVGIDLAQNFVEITNAHNIPGARFQKMDMRRLEFPDNSFDGVWACASLHHIPKEEGRRALLEFHRVLRNKGLLFVSTRNGNGEEIVRREKDKGKPKFFSYYTETMLREAVVACGFRILKSKMEESVTGVWAIVFARKE